MDDGNGRINALAHEQERHRFSDNHTAAQDDDIGAGEGDRALTKQAQTSKRSAGGETRFIVEGELRDVEWVESVDIFARIERTHDGHLIDLWRWR